MKKTSIILTGLTMLAFATPVFAQSTVTGTLTSGASGTGSGSTVTGTVGTSSNTLTGTVVSTTTTGGGGGGTTGGGGGGGGGSGTNTIDICTNIDGVQSSLPNGYVLSGSTCVLSSTGGTSNPGIPNTGTGGTGGTGSTVTPGIPNTGAGGEAAGILALLLAMAALALGSTRYLKRLSV